uniref:G-protein coupled receptors family 1 profile domain-containing protein n=1 Tax=Panagrolaimus sp. PS1159 TaxID=55785 RepID=A0AC35FDM1_9BILA
MERLAVLVHDEIGLTDIRFSSFCYARSFSWMLHCLTMMVLFTLCYIIIIYCFVKTNMYFNKNSEFNTSNGTSSNERILKCQKEVTKALCLQSILPTINVIELVFQTTLLPVLFPGVHIVHVMVYAAIPLYCIPLLNPFIIIITVKPYWRAILSIIPWMKNTRIYASTHGTTIATPSIQVPLSSIHR